LKTLRRLLLALVGLAIVGAGGLYVATPFIEQRLTFKPRKYDPAQPWTLPANTEDISLTTADGVRLHGWFFAAAEPRTGLTVLYLHGNSGTLRGVTGDAQFLQARGFDVFAIDYRGYGKSEGTSESEATLLSDGRAALRYLTDTRKIAPDSIVLWGHSLGTVPAAELATSGPCRALVLIAPVASARRQAHDMLPWLPDPLLFALRSRLDTEGRIDRARCEVFIAHSEGDRTVRFPHGQAVFAAAREPKRFVAVPGDAHILAMKDGRSYAGEILEFLRVR
jgi:fermentation-respiration switch protein FrsA (DUF1100 family)